MEWVRNVEPLRNWASARLIEDAIRHHLAVLAEFPEEFVVPTRLVISKTELARLSAGPTTARPKAALRALMTGR